MGPLWRRIVAEHVAYEPGRSFTDRIVEGPFASWEHQHIIEPAGDDAATLIDVVQYELPLGAVGRLFDFRHAVTRQFCESGASA